MFSVNCLGVSMFHTDIYTVVRLFSVANYAMLFRVSWVGISLCLNSVRFCL